MAAVWYTYARVASFCEFGMGAQIQSTPAAQEIGGDGWNL